MARKDISRRDFVADAGKLALGAAVTPGFPMIVPRHVLGGVGYRAPSDIVNFAVVGFRRHGVGERPGAVEDRAARCRSRRRSRIRADNVD